MGGDEITNVDPERRFSAERFKRFNGTEDVRLLDANVRFWSWPEEREAAAAAYFPGRITSSVSGVERRGTGEVEEGSSKVSHGREGKVNSGAKGSGTGVAGVDASLLASFAAAARVTVL